MKKHRPSHFTNGSRQSIEWKVIENLKLNYREA